jgi:hypothetical protein
MVCDEHCIGGDGEHCGDNDTQLERINVLYYEASGGKYVPRAVFYDLEPGVFGAVRASPLGKPLRPDNIVHQNAGAGSNWANGHYTRAGHKFYESSCTLASVVVNSEPHTRAVLRSVCAGPELPHCAHLYSVNVTLVALAAFLRRWRAKPLRGPLFVRPYTLLVVFANNTSGDLPQTTHTTRNTQE